MKPGAKERPILFSAPMVRAILDGRKTRTRRLVRWPAWATDEDERANYAVNIATVSRLGYFEDGRQVRSFGCPHGASGDRLWVRETWYDDDALRDQQPRPTEPDELIEYRADHDCHSWEAGCPCRDDQGRSCWRPSIHMPRWASRITLEIEHVRVERLQDVTEKDAKAEGVGLLTGLGDDQRMPGTGERHGDAPYRFAFALLWDEINGEKAPWSSNPWVWVLGFRRILDAVPITR